MAFKCKAVLASGLGLSLLAVSCGPLAEIVANLSLTQMFTWLGGLNNNWSVGNNWDVGEVPTQGSSVLIDGALPEVVQPVNVNLDVSPPELNDLTLRNGAELQVVGSGVDEVVRTLFVGSSIENVNGVISATMAGQLLLSAPFINQAAFGQGAAIEARDPAGTEDVPLTLVQIGIGSLDDPVQLQGGDLRTAGDNDVILLTTGVTVSNIRVETLPGTGTTKRRSSGCPDLECRIKERSGVVIPDGEVVKFGGTIQNDGKVTISAVTKETRLQPVPDSGATISGNGRVQLTDTELAILGVAETLSSCPPPAGSTTVSYTNGTGHTIGGVGVIYGDFTNMGTILADEVRRPESSDPPDAPCLPGELCQKLRMQGGPFTNLGELLARNGGELVISDACMTQEPGAMIRAEADSIVNIERSIIEGEGVAAAMGGTLTINAANVLFSSCFNGPPPVGRSDVGNINIQNGSVVSLAGDAEISSGNFTVSGSIMSGSELKLAYPTPTGPTTLSAGSKSMLTFSAGLEMGPTDADNPASIRMTDSTLETGPARLHAGSKITVEDRAEVRITASLEMLATGEDAQAELDAGTADLLIGTPAGSSAADTSTEFVEVQPGSAGTALLDISSACSATVRTLEVYQDGQIIIDGKVVIRDRYTFLVDNPLMAQWLPNSELRFATTDRSEPCATLEVGSDPNPDLEPLMNFGLHSLVIEEGAEVVLVNEHPNTADIGSEILVVQELRVDGQLDCNGFEVRIWPSVVDQCPTFDESDCPNAS